MNLLNEPVVFSANIEVLRLPAVRSAIAVTTAMTANAVDVLLT